MLRDEIGTALRSLESRRGASNENATRVAEEMIAGRYRLLEPLGRGPMSSVWLAEDDELQRRVAVKVLALSADPARVNGRDHSRAGVAD